MKKLIITADDYGSSSSINEAIETCMAAGTVHATCVMMNMPAFLDMVPLKTRFPQASIGIHWTLTHGSPILPASQIPSLIGINGEFHPKAQFKRKWITGQINESELKAELSAQFQRFHDNAGIPSFWCTHQDVHIFPGLFQTCVNLGLKLGIPAMRSHRRVVVSHKLTPAQYFIRHPAFWLKSKIVAQWSDWAESLGMVMPDGQIQVRGYNISLTGMVQALNRLEWPLPHKVVELTVHPAFSINEKIFQSLKISRLNEYQIFSDPLFNELISRQDIQLVGYSSCARCNKELIK